MSDNYIVQILTFLYDNWFLTMMFLLIWQIGRVESKYNSPVGKINEKGE